MATTEVHTSAGAVPISYTETGTGRPYLLLHGGAGTISIASFAQLLAAKGNARVVSPVHPGFQGTPRPATLTSVRGLAEAYSAFLDALDLRDVTVFGNSIGGWVAVELALQQNPRIGRLILADAGGLRIDAYPAVDFFALSLNEVTERSYRHPERFRIDPSKFTDQQRAGAAANRAAVQLYGGTSMSDPSLLGRLPEIRVPTLVVWGAADRIFPRQHGEAYAQGIPGARFEVIEEAGHLPQTEAPDLLLRLVEEFVTSTSTVP